MPSLTSYRELIVWQKSIKLVKAVYQLTATFPKDEIFGLTSQMRRASVSIPANIAEGRSRNTRKDFSQFLRIAFSSGAELESHIVVAKELSLGESAGYNEAEFLLSEVMRMLKSMIQKLTANS